MENFIRKIPKAELHIHIEGSFEPELMFEIASRNKLPLKYKTVEDIRAAYDFNNLQEFLDIYYEGASVLLREEDFYDLTYAYLQRAAADNIVHSEIFFDPQTHTGRGVAFATVIKGISAAMEEAEKNLGISSLLIMSFLRHLSEEEAFATLKTALPWRDKIFGIGLDSSEKGNPPQKFSKVFAECKKLGFKLMAHAGEEGPAQYVADSLDILKIDRIDHGNRCLDNPQLVERIVAQGTALTVCPLSNLKLKVVKDMRQHPLKKMLESGLKVTVNSDDPAYFGGYVNDNYFAVGKALNLSKEQIRTLAANSIEASFMEEENKKKFLEKIKTLD